MWRNKNSSSGVKASQQFVEPGVCRNNLRAGVYEKKKTILHRCFHPARLCLNASEQQRGE